MFTDILKTHLMQPSRRTTIGFCLAAFYLPYVWLLFVESLWPWNAPQWTWTQPGITPWTWSPNHRHWVKLWPILPGWVPTMVFNGWVGVGRVADWLECLIGGVVTIIMFGGTCWGALRSGRWTFAYLGVIFLGSSLLAWLAYNFYAW